MTTTDTIMMTVNVVLRYPWKWRAAFGPMAIGQKLSRMLRTPAVSVVVATKVSGRNVTQAYLALPRLMMIVVPTASATDASSWFAMPNIGQIVLMLPAQMK